MESTIAVVYNTVNYPFSGNSFFFMIVELNLADEDCILVPDANISAINHLSSQSLELRNKAILAFWGAYFRSRELFQTYAERFIDVDFHTIHSL